MTRKNLFAVAALMLATLACSALSARANRIVGSGHVASEVRQVADFNSVELAGSADVNIVLGESQSVNMQADDNILPVILTSVNNGKLVINTKPFTSITPSTPVVVTVAMKSLKSIMLSGSGNVNAGAISEPELVIELPGSGDITAEGVVDKVTISVAGSGNVHAEHLKAQSAKATIAGSGTIALSANRSLDASILGSGTIHYTGNPAQVTKSITGSGTITP